MIQKIGLKNTSSAYKKRITQFRVIRFAFSQEIYFFRFLFF